MAQTTSSNFLGVRNPMAHYIPLWVIVVFTFFVVVLSTMGGLQEGLAKRQFPDTKVNGDLEVTKAIANPTGVVGPTSSMVTVAAGTFSPLGLVANTTYLVTGTITASACILPSGGSVGDTIVVKMVTTTAADLMVADGVVLSFSCSGGEQFETNSYVLGAGATAIAAGDIGVTVDGLLSAAGQTVLNITGATAGGPGNGSEHVFTKISSNRWFLRAIAYGAGAATTAPLASYAFA